MKLSREELDQITRLDQQRAVLSGRRAELLRKLAIVDHAIRRVDIEKAQFSRIYTIPDDVVKMILEEACAHAPPPTRIQCEDHLCPSTASQICRRWREIAINLPTIWTCIQPIYPIKQLKLCLERSANQKLHIRAPGFMYVMTEQCAALLFEHAPRWKSVVAKIFHLNNHIQRAHKKSIIFEALEYVAVANIPEDDDPLPITEPHAVAPVLKHLSLTALTISFSMSRFEQLQFLKLKMTRICSKELYDLTRAAPSLIDLVLIDVQKCEAGHERREPRQATFTALKTLLFSDNDSSSDWESIAGYIDAPSLGTLVCHKSYLSHSPLESPIIYPSLTHIRLEDCTTAFLGPIDGRQLFRRAPNLTSVAFIGGSCTAQILESLTVWTPGTGTATGPLMPALKIIVILRQNDRTCCDKLYNLIGWHKASVTPSLKEVWLDDTLLRHADQLRHLARRNNVQVRKSIVSRT